MDGQGLLFLLTHERIHNKHKTGELGGHLESIAALTKYLLSGVKRATSPGSLSSLAAGLCKELK